MILLGGPLHGSERHIDKGENELTIMAPSPGNPIPMPFKYVRRSIQAETRPGTVFQREVLVAQDMPPEIATQALGSLLLENFANELLRQYMEGGENVSDQFGSSDSEDNSGNRSATESGLIITSR